MLKPPGPRQTEPRRDEAGRFRPGASGNASGRPRLAPEIRDACRDATEAVIARWRREVEENGPDWVAASKLLMAYGWGSPTATVEVGRADTPEPASGPPLDIKRLSLEELEALGVVQRALEAQRAREKGAVFLVGTATE